MTHPSDNSTGNSQNNNDEFIQQGFVDAHCHCLPAVDDGPQTMDDALALCQALKDDGITTVCATPHQMGRFEQCNHAPFIREKVAELNEQLKQNDISLNIVPGGDVRVDERICQLIEEDKILTLADKGKYILLELPHEIFIDIDPLIIELNSMGITPIISHPERHPVLAKQPQVLFKWLEHSAHIQITAGSLLGGFGSTVRDAAWNFLHSGTVSIVATDSHGLRSRRPHMREAYLAITTKLGETVAEKVCIKNPSMILNNQNMDSPLTHKQKAMW